MEHLPIFVYGTLKRGEERARCWPHAPTSVIPATTLGTLYDLGPYPALTEGSDTVAGELWFIELSALRETLRVLDEIECYGNADVDLYERRIVPCHDMEGNLFRAYTYFLADRTQLNSARRPAPDRRGLYSWNRNQR